MTPRKIKDQILAILCFGQNDTTFDMYSEEFGITLKQEDIEDCICGALESDRPAQNFLFDDLFMEIIRKCLIELEIINNWEDLDTEWLGEIGFSWDSNCDASRLYFNGKTYTKKEPLYEAVKRQFDK